MGVKDGLKPVIIGLLDTDEVHESVGVVIAR